MGDTACPWYGDEILSAHHTRRHDLCVRGIMPVGYLFQCLVAAQSPSPEACRSCRDSPCCAAGPMSSIPGAHAALPDFSFLLQFHQSMDGFGERTTACIPSLRLRPIWYVPWPGGQTFCPSRKMIFLSMTPVISDSDFFHLLKFQYLQICDNYLKL